MGKKYLKRQLSEEIIKRIIKVLNDLELTYIVH